MTSPGEEDSGLTNEEDLSSQCQRLREENQRLQQQLRQRNVGVNELSRLLQDQNESVFVLKEKNRQLEASVVRLERLNESLRSGSTSSTRPEQSPFIPGPSRKILETLMQENSELKKAINNLQKKGLTGYLEAVKTTQLEEFIKQQKKEIDTLRSQIMELTSSGEEESALGGGEGGEGGGPLSLPGSVTDTGPLKRRLIKMQQMMAVRDRFCSVLSQQVTELQKKLKSMQSEVAGVKMSGSGDTDVNIEAKYLGKIHQLKEDIKNLSKEKGELEDKIEEMVQLHTATLLQCENFHSKNKSLKSELDRAHEVDSRGDDVGSLRKELLELQKTMDKQAEDYSKELSSMKKDLEDSYLNCMIAESQNYKSKKELEQKEIEISELKTQVASLQADLSITTEDMKIMKFEMSMKMKKFEMSNTINRLKPGLISREAADADRPTPSKFPLQEPEPQQLAPSNSGPPSTYMHPVMEQRGKEEISPPHSVTPRSSALGIPPPHRNVGGIFTHPMYGPSTYMHPDMEQRGKEKISPPHSVTPRSSALGIPLPHRNVGGIFTHPMYGDRERDGNRGHAVFGTRSHYYPLSSFTPKRVGPGVHRGTQHAILSREREEGGKDMGICSEIVFHQEPMECEITSFKEVSLKGPGIHLTIPENSLGPTEESVTLSVHPCIGGPFKLPDGYESASPVYMIKYSRKVEFLNNVTVKIDHYAHLKSEEDCDNMVFLSASSTPALRELKSMHIFKEIEGPKGVFRPGCQVGEIALRHFCLIRVGKRKQESDSIIPGSKRSNVIGTLYSARLYKNLSRHLAKFCVCLYQEVYTEHCDRTVMKESAQGWELSERTVQLESEEVTLCVVDGKGWDIIFETEPATILRRHIDLPEELHRDISKYPYPPTLSIRYSVIQPQASIRLGVSGLDTDLSYNIKVPIPVSESSMANPPQSQTSTSDTSSPPLSLTLTSQTLANPSLSEAFRILYPVAHAWENLGVFLGISSDELANIKCSYDEPQNCLREMLKLWLKRVTVPPTWQSLVEAVTVIDQRIALRISEKYK